MFKNDFKAAWRSLIKNKPFALINIAGLSIGMAACLLILQYVSFELSFDQFNKNAGDLYRVYNDRYQNGRLTQHGTITYSAIGKAMQDEFPEVINHTRIVYFTKQIIGYQTKKIGGLRILAADNSFLVMFSYPLLAGNSETALKEPNSIILSKSLAQKIFGADAEALNSLLGKAIQSGNDSVPLKITGIAKDVPENSHLQFDAILSYNSLYSGPHPWKDADYSFQDSDFWHYIQLRKGTDYQLLEARFPAFSEKYFQGTKVSGCIEKFHLQPITKAHLYSDFEYEIGKTASATVVWGLLVTAILIIAIAWVNYINLSTAKSLERAKEVGIRKVSGARRSQLVQQFLTESIFVNAIALACAFMMVTFAQHAFNQLIHHELSLFYLMQKGLTGYSIILTMAFILIAGVLVSGFYPAYLLSSFKPIMVLKGKYTHSQKGTFLRKALVVGQFAITVVLITGSIVVYRQMKYVQEQDLGFNMDQMLVVKGPQLTNWDSTFISKQNAFIAEVKQIPLVSGAAFSWRLPGDELGRNFDAKRTDAPSGIHIALRNNAVSPDFIGLYRIKLLAGRNFEPADYHIDWEKLHYILLNETAVRLLGFSSPLEAVGKQILQGDQKWDIKGVMADFHQKSLRYPIEPTMFFPASGTYSPFSIRVNPAQLDRTIARIRAVYSGLFPGNLFDYYFLDEQFNLQYANDSLFGKIFAIFTGFAILIACLGLLGLALFATIQRTKEIGVRKVMGAPVFHIILLLSKDFMQLILFALVIAIPLAWYLMHRWLLDFAYRTSMSWWIFVAAGLLAFFVAVLTISFQTFRAAMADPVKCLRTE